MKRGIVLACWLALLAGCAQAPQTAEPRTAVDANEPERRAAMRIELAGGYFARGQHNIALDEVKQALVLRPDSREGLNLRALILAAMGEHDAALESFRRALTVYPSDPDTLHNLGWYHCQQRQWAPSFARFDEALAQSSYRSPSRTLLAKGVCEQRAERLDLAAGSLRRAFELDPGNPAINFANGELLLRIGKLESARFHVSLVNKEAGNVNAQSLWLAARVEQKMGNRPGVTEWGQRLVREFPQSAEAEAFRGGRYE